MTLDDYKSLQPTLPDQPGVYKYIDEEGVILYVGKAKSLKKRVASYFVGSITQQAHKTRTMLKHARTLEFIIVETETDALLLENTLIKKFQPRYNVMLKDGKSYSYICIKNERFPRVYLTRKVLRDGSTYFGPYTSRFRLKVILELIKTLFPLRNCTYNLSEDQIASGKYKVCLEYHIKNCQGPCVGYEDEASYNEKIEQIKNILKGHFGPVKRHFTDQMERLAEHLEFEKAHLLKEKLTAFEDYQGKSTVVNPNIRDVDVFSIASDDKQAYVNYVKVVNGAIINTLTEELVKNLDQEEKDILEYAIPVLRERFNSIAPEVLTPIKVDLPEGEFQLTVPKIGDKRKLVELSVKNVLYYKMQQQRDQATHERKQTPAERILRTLQEDLQMSEAPLHIECFDNSNIQGSNPVSSCVVFKNARPSKKDYRHFNVKSVEGPNDFASMEEVVYRRYKRLLDEEQSLPQLVIIDGGKGQLSAAMESLKKLGIADRVTVIGIAKRLEEIFFPNDPLPLYINKKSESLKLIQQARNEAHRFAITFHRNQRSRNFTQTELTSIPGIGEKTAEKLLRHFGSVKKVREALITDLSPVIGPKGAKAVRAYFENL